MQKTQEASRSATAHAVVNKVVHTGNAHRQEPLHQSQLKEVSREKVAVNTLLKAAPRLDTSFDYT